MQKGLVMMMMMMMMIRCGSHFRNDCSHTTTISCMIHVIATNQEYDCFTAYGITTYLATIDLFVAVGQYTTYTYWPIITHKRERTRKYYFIIIIMATVVAKAASRPNHYHHYHAIPPFCKKLLYIYSRCCMVEGGPMLKVY